MFPRNVHIVFNCAEDRRITEPLLKHPPDKLYYYTAFIKATGQKDENMQFFQSNVDVLKQKIPSLKVVHKEIDYTEYLDIIQDISNVIKEEREINPNCQIFVNIGSGSKITTLAAAEASRLWQCGLYYVHSARYHPNELPRHDGELIVKKPVVFPITKPNPEYIQVLKTIEELMKKKYQHKDLNNVRKFVSKRDLLEALIEKKIIQLQKKNEDYRKRSSSYYAKLNQGFLNPLENDLKYITISHEHRNNKIYLTAEGEDALAIFKYLI
ncbi:MAG: hypothetical protein JW891_04160 [Candidatus Lokiarchaeota archaeon]|nr:hypothetical protein [Candidatus Lokiarchaeota archaeon]